MLLEAAPKAAVVHAVHGTLLARRNNPAAARTAFERSLQLTPGSVEALGGLTILDVQAKNSAAAVSRLEAEIAKQPANAPLLALLARTHHAAGNPADAEHTLRRAVTADPRFNAGYVMLAELYARQGRVDEALTEFQGIVSRDGSAIGARTMVGILLDTQGRRDEAVNAYEATVKTSANAPVAANNLAFIYAERGQNLDVALQLATTAKQRLPEDPNVDDTLGWIYYKRGQPAQAIPYLQASLKRQPDAADVLYHLGMAYAGAGDHDLARETLERALRLDPKAGGEDARRTLEAVSSQ
jgi:tetratricopeptide (TPR) repeat protein